nr:hypothetical protein [Streptomyces graminilatus]
MLYRSGALGELTAEGARSLDALGAYGRGPEKCS